jgi:O-antigen ligase
MELSAPRGLSPYILGSAVVAAILLANLIVLLGANPAALGIAAGVATVVTLIINPRWLWLLLIAGLPFSVEVADLLGTGNNLVIPTEVLAPLTAISIAFWAFRTHRIRWTVSPLHATIAFFVLVQAISLSYSAIPLVTLKALARTLTGLLGGYILTQIAVQSPRDLRTPFRILFVTTLLLVAYGLYTQFVEGISIYQDIAYPFFGNHCIYAAYLCFPAAFVLAVLTQPVSSRTTLTVFLVAVSLAILLSFVRGAWMGMLALVPYLVVRQGSRYGLRLILILLLLGMLCVFGVAALNLQDLLEERWRTLFDIGYVANESRIDRWMAALSMWMTHPILGVGLGCFPDLYFQHVYDLASFEVKLHMGAHNLYLEILAELGAIGLLAYVLVIGAFFIEVQRFTRLAGENPRLRALGLGLESMMVVYLVHAFVNNLGPSDEIDIAFWSTCGLVVTLRCALQRENARIRAESR